MNDPTYSDSQTGTTPARRFVSRRALAQIGAWVVLGAVIAGGITVAGSLRRGHASTVMARVASRTSASVANVSGRDPVTGNYVSLSQFTGKPVLINIWASWCPGCNQEARALQSFAAAHPSVQVLGIDIEDTTGGARAFYRKWDLHYPSIGDPNGTLSARLAATGVPTTLFLDAHHRLVDRLLGAGDSSDFEAGLRAINRRSAG